MDKGSFYGTAETGVPERRIGRFWRGDFTNLRVPKLFELRADPFERGDDSILYDK